MTKTLDQLKSELLAEFGDLPHGQVWEDPTDFIEFDKAKSFLSSALDTVAEKTAEAVEVENDSEYISEIGWSNHPELAYRGGKKFGFNQAVYRQSLKRDKWLK